jgi:hypothetical protein
MLALYNSSWGSADPPKPCFHSSRQVSNQQYWRRTMPAESPYYTPDVPDDQKEAVKAISNRILRQYGIESATLLLTNVDLPEELVINTSNLQLCTSLPPASSALLPEIEILESLVSRFSNILIIPLWVVDLFIWPLMATEQQHVDPLSGLTRGVFLPLGCSVRGLVKWGYLREKRSSS